MNRILLSLAVFSLFSISCLAQVFNTSVGFAYDAIVEEEQFPGR
ncbi:MAG: hypothetical protein U5L96_12475 [Owenweeksia sp.]|nr:hypothetical protein [Owenweeksia sp.]